MKRSTISLLPVLLAAAAASVRAADIPEDLVYEAPLPAYAALEKQSAAFVAKLRAAPDDTERSVAAESFLSYLAGVESKLAAAGKADYASEVRAYREKVLLYREDLRAEAEDPFAGDGGDPFAASVSMAFPKLREGVCFESYLTPAPVNASAMVPANQEYRLLSAEWLTEVFEACNERLAQWLEAWQALEGEGKKASAEDIRVRLGLRPARQDL